MGKYGNMSKMIEIAQPSWQEAAEQGLVHIRTRRAVGDLESRSARSLAMPSARDSRFGSFPSMVKGKMARERISLAFLDDEQ